MKRPDLLTLIAIWEFISALFALFFVAALSIWGFSSTTYDYNSWGMMSNYGYWGDRPVWIVFCMSFGVLVLLCYIAVAILGGIGILMGREWGRIISLVHNGLSLFAFPPGTIIGTLAIIYLTRAEAIEYFTANKPKAPPPGSATPQ